MDEWLKGPKSPGLMVLEHEVDDDAVQAFINVYPSINENGWQVVSLARFNNPNSLQTPPDHTLDTDIDDNTNKEYQDTPPPIPFQPLESSSSFLEGLRPDRFYRVWDEEAYLQFGGVRLVSMIVIILLCVLIFSSTVHVCGCCSRRKGKIQIE